MTTRHIWQPGPSDPNWPCWYALPVHKPVLKEQDGWLCATWEYRPARRFLTRDEALASYDDPDYLKEHIEALEQHISHLITVHAHAVAKLTDKGPQTWTSPSSSS